MSTSIIIATFNNAAYIGMAIESCLAQTALPGEIVVVDDGSTDGTGAILAPFTDRIRYFCQPNQGVSVARNVGVELSSGEHLLFLDGDDELLPDGLAKHLAQAGVSPDVDVRIGGSYMMTDVGKILGESKPWLNTPDPDLRSILYGCSFCPGAVLLARAAFEGTVGFKPGLRVYEDLDLWLKLALAGSTFGWTKEIVMRYRQHEGSASAMADDPVGQLLQVVDAFFADPRVPADIMRLHDEFYCYLRVAAAGRRLVYGDRDGYRDDLAAAVELDPALRSGQIDGLVDVLGSWALYMRVSDPMDFVHQAVSNLPEGLTQWSGAINKRLRGRVAAAKFFGSDRTTQGEDIRSLWWHALSDQPTLLANRGAWRRLADSVVRDLVPSSPRAR